MAIFSGFIYFVGFNVLIYIFVRHRLLSVELGKRVPFWRHSEICNRVIEFALVLSKVSLINHVNDNFDWSNEKSSSRCQNIYLQRYSSEYFGPSWDHLLAAHSRSRNNPRSHANCYCVRLTPLTRYGQCVKRNSDRLQSIRTSFRLFEMREGRVVFRNSIWSKNCMQ